MHPTRSVRATKRVAVLLLLAVAVTGCQPPPGATRWASDAQLAALRRCESGGNYRAVSPSGAYRGAYQFDRRTWRGVGGSGDPAAAHPLEQDHRARLLHSARGWSPWPVCGRRAAAVR